MASRVNPKKEPLAGWCSEPHCDRQATFTISRGTPVYQFCERHVWPRVHMWLAKLPPGEAVSVSILTQPAEKLPG